MYVTPAARAVLSKPLANPSTLDRRPAVAKLRDSPSYVEELWSPAPRTVERKRRQKPPVFTDVFFCAPPLRGLSLSGGASSPSRFSHSEHHLWKLGGLGPETTKATSSVALAAVASGVYYELDAAPYEGRRRDARAAYKHRLPARQVNGDRHGGSGAVCVGEGQSGHGSSACRTEHRRSSRRAQCSTWN